MKKTKKIASLLLALIMTLAMAMPVFATTATPPVAGGEDGNTVGGTGDFTITINAHEGGDAEGYVYDAYQIFSGDLKQETKEDGTVVKTLSNIVWGSGVKGATTTDAEGNSVWTMDPGLADALNAEYQTTDAKEIAKIITGEATTNQFDTEAAVKFASIMGKYLSDVKSTSVAGSKNEAGKVKEYTISGLTAGYYLVSNSAIPDQEEEGSADAYTRYMMEVVGNVTATPKSDVPTADKKIKDGNQNVDVNDAAIGDTVTYEITGTLPTNFADYTIYHYIFKDNLSKGLTADTVEPDYDGNTKKLNAKVEIVNGTERVDVSKYFYMGAVESETGTAIEIGMENIKDLACDKDANGNAVTPIAALTSSSKIVVTYSATVNSNAEIGKNPNTNDVILDFSNNPNYNGDGPKVPPENPKKPDPKDPSGTTPKKTVETFVTGFSILKVDENGDPLKDVEFTLTGENGEKITLVTKEVFKEDKDGDYWLLKNGSYTTMAPIEEDTEEVKANADKYASTTTKYALTRELATTTTSTGKTEVVGTVDATTGRVTFTGLGSGDYKLNETKTPAGYNTIEEISFTISFDSTSRKFSSSNPSISLGTDNTLETTIVNKKGSTLPSTGGIGTTIFYVVGTILILVAGVLLITKKRMSKEV